MDGLVAYVNCLAVNWDLGQKKARMGSRAGFCFWGLAIPYFHMANCHTIIGTKRFHFRVRDGSGWFTLAMVTKQFGAAGASPRLSYAPHPPLHWGAWLSGYGGAALRGLCFYLLVFKACPPAVRGAGRSGVIWSSLTGN